MSFPRYPKYKESGVEWLGDVPEHWQVLRLKHVASDEPFAIVDGPFGTQLKAEDYRESGVPLIRISNLSYEGHFSEEDLVFIDGAKANDVRRSAVRKGDVLLGKTGATIGKSALFDVYDFGIIASSCLKITPDQKVMCPRFLLYSIVSGNFQSALVNESGGSTRDTINITPFGNLPIAVASMQEQNTICTFLDRETAKIDALVAEQQRLIDLLKEKRQALISHAVTKGLNPDARMKPSGIEWLGEVPEHWEIRRFGQISSVVRGASPRPAGDPSLFDGNFSPWVTVAEITKDEEINLTSTSTFLTARGSEQSRLFSKGTLLLSNSGGSLGVPKILQIDANANDGVLGFLDLSLDHHFAYFYLSTLTEDLREMVKKTGGSTQINLNTDLIKQLAVPVPPADEVNQITDTIFKMRERHRSLEADAEHAIGLLQERRTALISAAVTGKIDVRGLVETEAA